MGTRGTTGFVVNGVTTASYQQFDSYPDGVGRDVLAFARTLIDPTARAKAKAQAAALVIVPEDGKPTDAQRAQVARFANVHVSDGSDWYSTLRNCQGLPGAILDSGFILDSELHQQQYDWQIDFDAEMFRGFRVNELLEEYSLDDLPSDEEFLADMEAAEESYDA